MATDADGERDHLTAMREQYQERRIAQLKRRQWQWVAAMGVLWAALGVGHWLTGNETLAWLLSVLAVVQLAAAAFLWRKVRDEPRS